MRYVVFFLLFLAPSMVNASLIKINVKGSVTQIDPIFLGIVNYGDDMNASFIFDTAGVSRSYQFEPHRAFHYLPELSYTIQMGLLQVQGLGGRAEVTNDNTDSFGRVWDRFILQDGGAGIIETNGFSSINSIINVAAGLTFYDYYDANALKDTMIPKIIPLDLFSGSSHTTIQINLDNGEFDWLPLFAKITSSEVIYVNQPNSASLMFLSILFLMRHYFRRNEIKK